MSRQSPIEPSEEDVIEIDFIILWLGKMCLCVIFCSNNICGDVGDAFEVEKKHVLPRAPGVECSVLRF